MGKQEYLHLETNIAQILQQSQKEVFQRASGHQINKQELNFEVHHNSASLDSLFGCT